MSSNLPQVCTKCRKLKLLSDGKLIKSTTRWNKRYFVCTACLSLPQRLSRVSQESRPEREVREAFKVAGIGCYFAEYPVDRFKFDFGFPKLRLLIELDSKLWHGLASRKKRDQIKDRVARAKEWEVVRIQIGEDLGRRAVEAVRNREAQL